VVSRQEGRRRPRKQPKQLSRQNGWIRTRKEKAIRLAMEVKAAKAVAVVEGIMVEGQEETVEETTTMAVVTKMTGTLVAARRTRRRARKSRKRKRSKRRRKKRRLPK
jgi:hypothetical protein